MEEMIENLSIGYCKTFINEVMKKSSRIFDEEDVDQNILDVLHNLWFSKVNIKINEKEKVSKENSTTTTISTSASTSNSSDKKVTIVKHDGPCDSSDESSMDVDVSDEAEDEGEKDLDEEADDKAIEDDPLGSDDDLAEEEDSTEVFESENIIVCQYEKITRSRNKWKLHLKYGIMNLNDKEYLFHKADGEAEW